jgi:hypothetical protein
MESEMDENSEYINGKKVISQIITDDELHNDASGYDDEEIQCHFFHSRPLKKEQ